MPRRRLFAMAAAGAMLVRPGAVRAFDPAVRGARLSADFEPVGAIWLGYDAGHEAFTRALVRALAPEVPIRMLVRDAPAERAARVLLRNEGVDDRAVRVVQAARAPFFVRDAAVFGLDGAGRPFVNDFQWTHYGWSGWCARTHGPGSRPARQCARTDDNDSARVDQVLAAESGWPVVRSPLAMEGGGVEVNGRGLMIANAELWSQRNPGLGRAAIEAGLLRLPGMRKVIWLPRGLAHDTLHRGTVTGSWVGWGTGGHTDEFVRFADARTVMLAWPDEQDARAHPVERINRARMQLNWQLLQRATDADGAPLRVIRVPMPRLVERTVVLSARADTRFSEQWSAAQFPARERRRDGQPVRQLAMASYLNHVLTDRLVLLPDYEPHGTPQARQQAVESIYRAAFPGREVRFIDALQANWYGGGAHCATLNEPRAAT